MKKIQNEKAITLVALVITIIILLILSGISISAITNTGLFEKANTAVSKYNSSQLEEKIRLAKMETEMFSGEKTIKDVFIENGTITKEQSEQGIINIDDESIFITNYEGIKELSNKSKNGDDFSNKKIYIINDIECCNSFNQETGELQEGENFEPIANFNGVLDGNGYAIKNLYIKSENTGIALISTIKENGNVKNLIIDNAYIEGFRYIGSISGVNYGIISNCISQNSKIIGTGNTYGAVVGGICGYNRTNGKVTDCTNKGEIIANKKLAGGICGYSLGGNITNCINYGKITGNQQVGGIVGDSQGTQNNIVSVSNCINYGTIYENYNKEQCGYIGGIVGCNYKYSEIINCTNKSGVNGTSKVLGGIVGVNHYSIKKCYNEGKIEIKRVETISGTQWLYLGGICGYDSGNIEECGNVGEIKSNYNTEDDSDGRFVGGISGYISVTNSKDIFDNAKISKCYNYGTIYGFQFVGGITGRVSANSSVEFCYNGGEIKGDRRVAGISGDAMNNNSKISNCYNIGKITANTESGGLCGDLENYIENSYTIGETIYPSLSKRNGIFLGMITQNGECKNCYYLIRNGTNGVGYEETLGLSDSIIGKSEEELKNLAEILGDAYTQDNNVNNGYPYLKDNKPIK